MSLIRRLIPAIVAFAAFGILVPWVKGLDFLDPMIVVIYAALAIIFVVPAAAVGKGSVRGPVLFSFGLFVATLAQAIGVVNFLNWHGRLLAPSWPVLCATAALAASGCATAALGAAALARRFGPARAKTLLRTAFLLTLLLAVFGSQRGNLAPTSEFVARAAFSAAAILAAVGVLLAKFTLRRSP